MPHEQHPLETSAKTTALQNTAFCTSKDGKPQHERQPLASQYATF
jgi:hypothetical protein